MTDMPGLRTALLDLLYETRAADLKLILGGGYGLYLKPDLSAVQAFGRCLLNGRWRGQRTTWIYSSGPNC